MKIYVIHASGFDFKSELYLPIKQSLLFANHEVVLPHEDSKLPTLSKDKIFSEYDCLLAEVSYPSTGLGIELGWANCAKKPVINDKRKV